MQLRRATWATLLRALPLLASVATASAAAQVLDDVDWVAYEKGELGQAPQYAFKSTPITAPIVKVERTSPRCDADSYTVLSYGTEREPGNKLLLIDSNGDLVWQHWERGTIHNAQVQRYKGQNFITYWIGDDEYFGHGHGYYKMYDDTYTLAHVIGAGGELAGDFHEFTITRDDTALITSYVKVPWDLTSRNVTNGYIWDCVFQEIDIETNKVLFEWHASDHFSFADMTVDSWQSWTGHKDDPWDWFHLNSVDKDRAGNFLLAARYTNAVTYIDGRAGRILWNVGGKRGSFREATSGGTAAAFVDPHMARWTVEGQVFTVFDNVAFWSYSHTNKTSRGVKVALDLGKWTAKIATEFLPPQRVFAEAEGSMQLLPNGNYFLGFGSVPYFAEFASDGELLCSAYYMPAQIAGAAKNETRHNVVKSYRVVKHAWTGYPLDAPKINIEGRDLRVSWNGATEVGAWSVAIKVPGDQYHRWQRLGTVQRTGFETRIPIEEDYFALHITAHDKRGVPYQLWYAEKDGTLVEIWDDTIKTYHSALPSTWAVLVAFLSLAGLGQLWINRRGVTDFMSAVRQRYRQRQASRGYMTLGRDVERTATAETRAIHRDMKYRDSTSDSVALSELFLAEKIARHDLIVHHEGR